MNQKIKFIIACLSLLICIFVIQDTYAKYINVAEGNANLNIARWRILVNTQDIRNNPEITNVITPTLMPNAHIAPNVIAPTSQGYFDLIIDSSAADVSFSYNIETTVHENSCVNDLVITGYSYDGGQTISASNNSTITNNIIYNISPTTTSIRVYIKWYDGENEIMNNADDANATLATCNAMLNVSISFVQITT